MISVVIPVYNSGKILSDLVSEILKVFKENQIHDFEIILVDDSSKDDSWEKIKKISKMNTVIKGYKLIKNFGQQFATLKGVQKSRGDIIITLDDDFQHPPQEIPKFIKALNNDIDVIYGVPIFEKRSFLRNLLSLSIKFFIKHFLKIKHGSFINSFRLFRKKLITTFDVNPSNVDVDAILFFSTDKFSYIKVVNNERLIENTHYDFVRLFNYTINMLVGFSVKPLRFVFILSSIFLIFGFGIMSFVIFDYFTSDNIVAGFTFISSLLIIFSGVQILLIGIIGEYVARIFLNSNKIYNNTIEEQTQSD